MREGLVVAEFQRKEATQEAVITAALGRHTSKVRDEQAQPIEHGGPTAPGDGKLLV
jgi:hypothetical protein